MWVKENISLAVVEIDQRPTTMKQMKSSPHILAMAIVLGSLGPIIRNLSSFGRCSLCLLR